MKLDILDLYPLENAQVSKGGISLDEIKHFRLKKYKHIYALGEMLDIDGRCGGFNLMFAFESALDCFKEISNEIHLY
jgi:predicted flavoprotein YhiN